MVVGRDTRRLQATRRVYHKEKAMRAARFRQFGGPEVSSVDTVPTPQPGADEVRMKIAAVGLNRADCAQYRGKLPSLSSLPSPLGCEGAGIVEAVGSNVDEGWLGKRVAALPTEFQSVQGTLAEKIVVPIEALVPCPDGFSDAECSAIWLHYLTAYAGLVETAHVGMGDFVLVNSAATNLGIASIQIAKTERATTIAIVGDGRWKNELHNLGADYVLSTDKDDLEFGVRKNSGPRASSGIYLSCRASLLKGDRLAPIRRNSPGVRRPK